jgi:predicted component of type VI protein secretion system
MQEEDVIIGGHVREREVSEAISLLPMNKTLIAQKLTSDPTASPEIVKDLRTIEDVFGHYKPQVDVQFEDQDGNLQNEELKFNTVADFGVKGVLKQSTFLRKMQNEKNELFRFMQILKSNKVLQKVLNNPEEKQAYIEHLKQILEEVKK